ncbi:hypothetical protein F4801DRAFT_603090 [Xylaria longipes]|nr:hypothetical protein F4801DRAFT_603090 [Xylaria longipes]
MALSSLSCYFLVASSFCDRMTFCAVIRHPGGFLVTRQDNDTNIITVTTNITSTHQPASVDVNATQAISYFQAALEAEGEAGPGLRLAMSGSEDLDNHYPYTTNGVRYETPPSAANFAGITGPQQHSSGYESDYESDYGTDFMDLDEDDPQPGLGDRLARLLYTEQHTDAFAPEPASIPEEDDVESGIGTFGVELEFLVVQCPKVKMDGTQLAVPDLHPNDPRWISSRMSNWELRAMQTKLDQGEDIESYQGVNGSYYDSDDEDMEHKRAQYSRNKLTRVLREKGLVVVKWPEKYINQDDADFVKITDFSESEGSDDEREENFPNFDYLRNFSSSYDRDQYKDPMGNVSAVLLKWQQDFEQYHATHDLKLYRTWVTDIESALDRCTVNGWNLAGDQLKYLRGILRDRLINARNLAKQARENERNTQVDPIHVPVPGLKPQYKAWTVTIDLSVDGNGMTAERYANHDNGDPYEQYYWFGAEVVSPVLAMGDERARQAVRDACGSLRDALRCHKPMRVSTGLHIHLGHTKGWSLFQAKRFASFWFLAEKTILSLHRADRDEDMKWCAKIGGGSQLWRANFATEGIERRRCSSAVVFSYPTATKRVYTTEFTNNTPCFNANMTKNQKIMLYYIWMYNSINHLHEALGENYYCRAGVKWRIRGKYSSLQGYEDPDVVPEPGTIEVRIMHGTLDADHINNWVSVLERITYVVRNLTDYDFQELLNQFMLDQTRERLLTLLGVPDDIRQYWLDRKRRDAGNNYWEYPDRDKVDWEDPFMVPGHRATHGPFWD